MALFRVAKAGGISAGVFLNDKYSMELESHSFSIVDASTTVTHTATKSLTAIINCSNATTLHVTPLQYMTAGKVYGFKNGISTPLTDITANTPYSENITNYDYVMFDCYYDGSATGTIEYYVD